MFFPFSTSFFFLQQQHFHTVTSLLPAQPVSGASRHSGLIILCLRKFCVVAVQQHFIYYFTLAKSISRFSSMFAAVDGARCGLTAIIASQSLPPVLESFLKINGLSPLLFSKITKSSINLLSLQGEGKNKRSDGGKRTALILFSEADCSKLSLQ